MEHQRYCSVEAAAARFDVSTAVIRGLLRRAALGGVKVAGEWRVELSSLEEYERANHSQRDRPASAQTGR